MTKKDFWYYLSEGYIYFFMFAAVGWIMGMMLTGIFSFIDARTYANPVFVSIMVIFCVFGIGLLFGRSSKNG